MYSVMHLQRMHWKYILKKCNKVIENQLHGMINPKYNYLLCFTVKLKQKAYGYEFCLIHDCIARNPIYLRHWVIINKRHGTVNPKYAFNLRCIFVFIIRLKTICSIQDYVILFYCKIKAKAYAYEFCLNHDYIARNSFIYEK